MGPPIKSRSNPETWVAGCTGYIGNNLGHERVVERFEHSSLEIEIPQIIIREANDRASAPVNG